MTIDVVQFFTGDAAASAAAEDGSSEVPPPSDYWIRNENDRLRTLPVAPDAEVTTNTLTSSETGDATKDVRVSLERLASFRSLGAALFWITVANATVVRINEQYLP